MCQDCDRSYPQLEVKRLDERTPDELAELRERLEESNRHVERQWRMLDALAT